jgi:hypothetical protein
MIEPGDADKMFRAALNVFRTLFEAGHKEALPVALALCLRFGRKPPKWVYLAWPKALEAAVESNDWNEVLGSPAGKGAHRKNRKLHRDLSSRIVSRALRSAKVVPSLFSDIADELRADGINISAATVKTIYYQPKARMLRILIKWCKDHGLNSDFLA